MPPLAPLLAQTKSTLSEVTRAEITNEALLEEDSKYDILSYGFVGTPFSLLLLLVFAKPWW